MTMNHVVIDQGTCTVCGLCTEVVPRCFEEVNGEVKVLATEKTCLLCGRCVALCPTGSIAHNVMNMKNFPEVSKTTLIKPEPFKQFIRERRSHRAFLDKRIPKEVLDELIDIVRYAPTGHNDQTVEIILIRNPEKRKKVSDLVVDFMALGRDKIAGDLEKLTLNCAADPDEIRELEDRLEFLGIVVEARGVGKDPIFYDAPAVAIFHSGAVSVTPKDNCMIAATTMGLYARTLGLETTYIGLAEPAANMYEPLMKELRLPLGHKVFSVLVIGYPKIEYLRVVDRKPIKTRWE
jgi:nitroreductase/NAD-dependent dihydropyrimidine dehydrogenase PreA subunit